MAKNSFIKKFARLFGIHKNQSDAFFQELTDSLIEGDIGAKTAFEITDELEKICKSKRIKEETEIAEELKKLLMQSIKTVSLEPEAGQLSVYMLLGVNGAGKTTTAAKLASFYKEKNANIVLAAADTFRAAAIEQLCFHGEKNGVRVVAHQHGADPSAVIFDAADACRASLKPEVPSLVIADTAGRLHNKENLVRELQKIDRIAAQKTEPQYYKKLIVLDATTGQNALRQAEVFNEAVGVDAAVLTKYDSTSKGGIVVTLGRELGIPVAFVCTGETYKDIKPFSAEDFAEDFLGC